MYDAPPPHASVSAAVVASGLAAPRSYQVWKGRNVFFLKGRFIFGPDVRSIFLTIFLIIVPAAIFCVFVARKLMDKFSHHTGICIMVIAVAFTLYVILIFALQIWVVLTSIGMLCLRVKSLLQTKIGRTSIGKSLFKV